MIWGALCQVVGRALTTPPWLFDYSQFRKAVFRIREQTGKNNRERPLLLCDLGKKIRKMYAIGGTSVSEVALPPIVPVGSHTQGRVGPGLPGGRSTQELPGVWPAPGVEEVYKMRGLLDF